MLKVNAKKRELYVYGEIGPAWAGMIDSEQFIDALDELGPGDISVRLSSPGGVADYAFEAVELLKRHDGQVNVTVDSLAASAGTFFLQKPFNVTAAKTARIMIHNPIGFTYGNIDDHQKTIEILAAYGESIKMVYSRMNLPDDELAAMLKAETWFTAKQALDVGLIDSLSDDEPSEEAKAVKIRNGMFKNPPQDLIQPKVETPRRIAAALKLRQLRTNLMR